MVLGFAFLNSLSNPFPNPAALAGIISIRNISRKQREVASTSAAALCASRIGSRNSFLYSSANVGHFNRPLFLLIMAQKSVPYSLVSSAGISAKISSIPLRYNSAPTIPLSKLTL